MVMTRLLFFCYAVIVAAQTPPGFTPAVTQTLEVAYGDNLINPAGKNVPRPVLDAPAIAVRPTMLSSTSKALLAMIDLDVLRDNQRKTNLHWLVPNVDISRPVAVVPTEGNIVAYRPPTPKPGDTPHRYVFLLYYQPANFTNPQQYANVSENRIGFDMQAYATATGLGAPVAANFILVQQSAPKRQIT